MRGKKLMRIAMVVSTLLLTSHCGQVDDNISSKLNAPSGHYIIIGSRDTFLKRQNVQSSQLELGDEKCTLYAGQTYLIQSIPEPTSGNHFRINLRDFIPGCSFSQGYVFRPHIASSSQGGNSGGTWIWPVAGPVSSEFGPRGGGFHGGIDIAVPTGRPIRAPRSGNLTSGFFNGGCGNTVTVNHTLVGGVAYSSRYCHLNGFVGPGKTVVQGDTIGYVGNTGNSTGPHLHLEFYRTANLSTLSSPINPRNLISGNP
ncbi:MAG: M23 family metallopeptidase [Pseudobacteriovorax sp.]|nr:M23 family metallopeptidase [Pseudobacteriovorax sp.]